MDSINIKDFALPKNAKAKQTTSAKGRLPRHRAGEKFLKGPIPLDWICHAALLPGKSFQVAIAIWFLAGLHKTATVKLNQALLSSLGVSRQCKYRALAWLTEAKLIEVDQSNGKNPVVTILPAGEVA